MDILSVIVMELPTDIPSVTDTVIPSEFPSVIVALP
jgi:hypothetical protein